MDINSLSSLNKDLYNVSNIASSKLENKLNSNMQTADDDELMEVCKEFEAYFIEQMYKQMLDTVTIGGESSDSTNALIDFYKDQTVQELAAQTSDQSNLGLAQALYEQMKRNYGITDIPVAEEAAPAEND